jgi:hypothetical protein
MGACRPCSGWGRSGSSSTPATGASRRTSVERDDCEAKLWLEPVRLERSRGFRRKEINRLRELVEEHREQLLESWNEFFRG